MWLVFYREWFSFYSLGRRMGELSIMFVNFYILFIDFKIIVILMLEECYFFNILVNY